MRKAPKGKIPYIEHDGRCFGDSHFIIRYLINTFAAPDGGADLGALQVRPRSEAERRSMAVADGLAVMAEESLYFVDVFHRWVVSDANFAILSPIFFASMGALRPLIAPIVRGALYKSLVAQGTARHAPEDASARGLVSLDALEAQLSDGRKFLAGLAKPTPADCAVYGLVANIFSAPFASPHRSHAEAHCPCLRAYWRRMEQLVGDQEE
jgi:glutathione S-transferase